MNDASGLAAAPPQSPTLMMTLRRAAALAQARSHRYVTLEHLLLALTDDQDAVQVLRSVNYDIEPLRARAGDVVNRFLSTLYAPGNTDLRPSYKLDRILQAATADAAKTPYGEVDGAFVVAALTSESDSVAAGLLRQHGLGLSQAMGWIYANRNTHRQGASQQNSPVREPASRQAPPPEWRPLSRSAPNSQLRSVPQNEKAYAPSPAPQHSPPRRERTLSAALENVGPDFVPDVPAQISSGRDLVVSKTSGKLVENIPRKMRIGAPTLIEISITREETAMLFRNLQGSGAPDAHDVIVTRAMTVTLKAPDGGFVIETNAAETQWLFDRPSFLETERFGRWRWTVTPTTSGKRRLQLVASARSVDENAIAAHMVTPDQVVEVRVRANHGRRFRKLLFWIFLIIMGAVLSETALRFGPFLFR